MSQIVFAVGDMVRCARRLYNWNDEYIEVGKIYKIDGIVEPSETGDLVIDGRCFSRDRFDIISKAEKDTGE